MLQLFFAFLEGAGHVVKEIVETMPFSQLPRFPFSQCPQLTRATRKTMFGQDNVNIRKII